MPRLETKGIQKYHEACLLSSHNLGLKLQRGWIFCTVRDLAPSRLMFEDIDGMAAGAVTHSLRGQTGDTNPVSAAQWIEWTNSDNKQVFFHKEQDIVIQRFIGIWPPRLRWWESFPQNMPRGDFSDEITLGDFSDSAPGYIDGLSKGGSPFLEPTTLTEAFIPKEMHIQEGLYNPEDYLLTPKMFIPIQRLRVHWLDPENGADRALIDRIMKRQAKVVLWAPGTDPWSYDAKAKLSIEPMEWI